MAFDSALYDQVVSERVMTVLGEQLAGLNAFSTDFTDQVERKKGNTMLVGLASGGTAGTNRTDYESGDSNIADISVTLNEIGVSWNITNKEYNASRVATVEKSIDAQAQTVAEAIWAVVSALITEANYGASIIDAAQTTFDADAMKTAWAAIPKVRSKHVLLDSVAYSEILPATLNDFDLSERGAYAFAGVHHQTDWSAASNNAYGFACGPAAMAVGSKIPEIPAGVAKQLDAQSLIEVEDLGLMIQYLRWGSAKTRAEWASLDVYFGAAVGQADAGALIASA